VFDQFRKYHVIILLGDLNGKFERQQFQTDTCERECTYKY